MCVMERGVCVMERKRSIERKRDETGKGRE
jgi:hypothetical protein